MQRSHRILVAAVQAASLVGCATTDFISPGQVARLDGYDTQVAPAAVKPVETLDGHRMWFNGETSLTLDSANQKTGGRFASIRVKDDVFVGKTTDGREVQVPLSAVRSAKVEQPSSMLTLVIMSYALGTIAAGTLALYALKESRIGSVDGRALRVNGKVVTAPLGRSQDWSGGHQPELSGLSSAARAALALHWHQTALAEHASVPAFSRLSLTLMALGAPGRLVDAAHRAAREEIQHARIAFSLASAYGGTEVAPGPLTELANAPAITATSLRALAAESLIDGCLMEGFGAAVIEAGRVRTADRPLRAVLAAIAREEASHAQLAWDIVGWCIEVEGAPLCAALMPLVENAPTPAVPRELPPALESELLAHGCISASEWRRLFLLARATVTERLGRLAGRRAALAA